MSPKQFEQIYPDFTGILYIDTCTFIDTKMIESLDKLKISYLKLNIFSLDTKLLKMFSVDIGPNLFRFQNGRIVDRLQSLVNNEKIEEFCNKV